jgi:hypothetical protein
VVAGSKTQTYYGDAGVDKVADENSGSDDFGVRIFLLVKVPCSAHAQKPSAEACPVQDQDDQVEHLKSSTIPVKNMLYLNKKMCGKCRNVYSANNRCSNNGRAELGGAI